MSIELTPQLEIALTAEAARRGTTPQALAEQLIESQLPTSTSPVSSCEHTTAGAAYSTLYDRWRKHIEAIKADTTPRTGPTNLSQDTGRRFAELLQEKRRQGRL